MQQPESLLRLNVHFANLTQNWQINVCRIQSQWKYNTIGWKLSLFTMAQQQKNGNICDANNRVRKDTETERKCWKYKFINCIQLVYISNVFAIWNRNFCVICLSCVYCFPVAAQRGAAYILSYSHVIKVILSICLCASASSVYNCFHFLWRQLHIDWIY